MILYYVGILAFSDMHDAKIGNEQRMSLIRKDLKVHGVIKQQCVRLRGAVGMVFACQEYR